MHKHPLHGCTNKGPPHAWGLLGRARRSDPPTSLPPCCRAARDHVRASTGVNQPLDPGLDREEQKTHLDPRSLGSGGKLTAGLLGRPRFHRLIFSCQNTTSRCIYSQERHISNAFADYSSSNHVRPLENMRLSAIQASSWRRPIRAPIGVPLRAMMSHEFSLRLATPYTASLIKHTDCAFTNIGKHQSSLGDARPVPWWGSRKTRYLRHRTIEFFFCFWWAATLDKRLLSGNTEYICNKLSCFKASVDS